MPNLIEFNNAETGQAGTMFDVTTRQAVLLAQHEYTEGQMDRTDLEGAYGGLVTLDTVEEARLGPWVARIVH